MSANQDPVTYCGEPVLLGVYIWQENSRQQIRIQPQYCRPGAFMGYSLLVLFFGTHLCTLPHSDWLPMQNIWHSLELSWTSCSLSSLSDYLVCWVSRREQHSFESRDSRVPQITTYPMPQCNKIQSKAIPPSSQSFPGKTIEYLAFHPQPLPQVSVVFTVQYRCPMNTV